jgi:exodeoxyribonuclease VII large subunit
VTIADLVADLRAATPSVAAELVIPRLEDLRQRLEELTISLKQDFRDAITGFRDRVLDLGHRLKISAEHVWEINANQLGSDVNKLSLLNPVVRLNQYQIKLLDLARQIYVRIQHLANLKESVFKGLVENLSSLNPLNILARGYSVTFKLPEGKIIKAANDVLAGDQIRTKIYQGEITSTVTEVN